MLSPGDKAIHAGEQRTAEHGHADEPIIHRDQAHVGRRDDGVEQVGHEPGSDGAGLILPHLLLLPVPLLVRLIPGRGRSRSIIALSLNGRRRQARQPQSAKQGIRAKANKPQRLRLTIQPTGLDGAPDAEAVYADQVEQRRRFEQAEEAERRPSQQTEPAVRFGAGLEAFEEPEEADGATGEVQSRLELAKRRRRRRRIRRRCPVEKRRVRG
ncbi:hypothetical protein XA68_15751 [Ophiocordyceps unilateralis]|uniref:Uncharacterized protein n=1 Tax=Ophiocordyceps unilateralis TaxID=268505 RepID=A0A2A9P6H9_OPHUN|nr:hypothetical protein XA68_15751 [Ophiocordyceps unilateralis]